MCIRGRLQYRPSVPPSNPRPSPDSGWRSGAFHFRLPPLGNNRLEEFLLSEGCEPVLPGLMDFCLYCIYNSVIDHELYKMCIRDRYQIQYCYTGGLLYAGAA